MGCDIHAHVELKLADGQWHHWNAPMISRDYELFTKLAGVRAYTDEIDPLAQPRGLPPDITPATRRAREHEGSCGHSDSWISHEEIIQLECWWNDRLLSRGGHYVHRDVFEPAIMGGYLDGNGYGELPKDVIDVRLVFWFDN